MRSGRILFIALLSVLLVACSVESPEERRARLHLPALGYIGDQAAGRSLFATNCAGCHGRSGRGSDQGPPLVDRVYRSSYHADLAFYRAVKDGVGQHHWYFGDMPPVANVTPNETADIVAYIRMQQRRTGID